MKQLRFQEVTEFGRKCSVGQAALRFGCAMALLLCGGCLTPPTLDKVVMAYDRSVTKGLVEQILLNVARAANREPMHFTVVSNIAATYDLRFSAGATPPLGGLDGGFSLAPIFGASIAENPTITIVPIEGEEFTQRLLTPFVDQRLLLLLRQDYDIDLLLRLMTKDFRTTEGPSAEVSRNFPPAREEYESFRRIVLHLSTIQDHNALYVEPIRIERRMPLPANVNVMEFFTQLGPDRQVVQDPQTGTVTLHQELIGRMIVTNYNSASLSLPDRTQLYETTNLLAPNEVLVDIRPGYPGGEYPLQGILRFRSFHAMLTFLGRSIDDQPEFDVPPDPRSGPNAENPPMTISIRRASTRPQDVESVLRYQGDYYYVDPDGPFRRWNAEGLLLLYQLFQMTVSEISRAGIPSLTIAK